MVAANKGLACRRSGGGRCRRSKADDAEGAPGLFDGGKERVHRGSFGAKCRARSGVGEMKFNGTDPTAAEHRFLARSSCAQPVVV